MSMEGDILLWGTANVFTPARKLQCQPTLDFHIANPKDRRANGTHHGDITPGGVLSGKVGMGMCGPDRVHF